MIPGLPPKPDDERNRRNPPIYKTVPVQWDGIVRGPELPKDVGVNWCPRTREWWEKWRCSPQGMVMHATDWEHMLETALLHNELWSPKIVLDSNGNLVQVSKTAAEMKGLATEIRSRVAAFGCTYEDRLKLRIEIRTPQSEADRQAEIASAAEEAINYAEMLAKEAANKGKKKK
jgi:hypothetical protein